MRGHAIVSAAAGAALLAGCASPPQEIKASYVSPVLYQALDCDQLALEATRVSDQVAVATNQQKKDRSNDAVATGIAIVLFWPAAFMVGGDKGNAAELASLKGQMDAIEQAAIARKYPIAFGSLSAAAASKVKAEEAADRPPPYPMNR